MALTLTSRGTGTHNTGATTLTVTGRSATLAAGSLGVLLITVDNAGASGSAVCCPTSTTDSKGNVWTRRQNVLYDNGAASAGIEGAIYTAHIDVALLTTDTVVLTWIAGVSPVAKAWSWVEVTSPAGSVAEYSTGATLAGATAANAQITTASVAVGDAVLCAYFSENVNATTGDSDTTNGSWSAQQTATVGTGTSGVRHSSQQKAQTTTSSTQSWDVTVASQDRAGAYIKVVQTTILAAASATGVATAGDAVLSLNKNLLVAVAPAGVATATSAALIYRGLVSTADGVGAVANAVLDVSAGQIQNCVGTSDGLSTAAASAPILNKNALASQADGLSTAASALAVTVRLTPNVVPGVATAAAAAPVLTVALASTATGVATADAVAPVLDKNAVVGSSTGVGNVVDAVLGNYILIVDLVGTSDGLSTAAATAGWPSAHVGVSDGLSTAASALVITSSLVGASVGLSTSVGGPLPLTVGVTGTATGIGAVSDAILDAVILAVDLVGSSVGVATVTGAGIVRFIGFNTDGVLDVGGTWTSRASISPVALIQTVAFTGYTHGRSVVRSVDSTQINIIDGLTGSSTGVAAVTSRLDGADALVGTSAGSGNAENPLNLDIYRQYLAETFGGSTAAAQINSTIGLSGRSFGASTAGLYERRRVNAVRIGDWGDLPRVEYRDG